MKSKLALLILFLLSSNAYSFEKAKVRVHMREMSETMTKLYPYLYNEAYVKEENGHKILGYLKELQKHFEQAATELDQSTESNFISATVIRSHIKETINSFGGNYKLYSQKMMQALPNLCFSCHAKDGISSLAVQNIKRKEFLSDFDFAEFNYMTRNYERADEYYDKTIDASANHATYENVLDKAFERKLSLYIKAFHSNQKHLLAFSKLLDKNELPKKIQTKVKSWVEILETPKNKIEGISKIGFQAFKKKYLKEKDLPKFIAGAQEKIHYLYLQEELESYFAKKPKKEEMPELLYWMAYIDRPLNNNLFYSLSEIYLKECILSYSRHPFAKKCYKEYEEAINFSFSGSAGTFIPDDVQKQLNDFKKLLGL